MNKLQALGIVVHDILMDNNFQSYKKLDAKSRKTVDGIVIGLRVSHRVRTHSGDLVMDTRPFTFGKCYTIKSCKIDPQLGYIFTMYQNGVVLFPSQFVSRVN